MKYALVFTLFGLVCAFYAVTSPPLLVRLLTASFAIAFVGVGLAYAFIGPRAFLKKSNGQLHPLSYLLFWPYHLLNALTLFAFRRSAKENPFDQIADNVYLGCLLSRNDEADIQRLGLASVLDLTCEFGETLTLRRLSYLCIPTLDTYPPSVKQLETGARWIQEEASKGPIYVHCALGHGRSATFVAAYLLLSGKANTPEAAIEHIQKLRPRIGLHPQQIAVLEAFSLRLNDKE